MLNVAVVGATGYTGIELIKILLRHPEVRLSSLTAKVEETIKIQDEVPELFGRIDMTCSNLDVDEVCRTSDFVFLALPHTVSMKFAPAFLGAGKKVVDLSADYRFSRKEVYEEWYGVEHSDPTGLKAAVYGLPELFRHKIKSAELIANPGCYPTGAILGMYPALKENLVSEDQGIVDAKTGVTGAGRKASLNFLFPEVNENFMAYNLVAHKHTPEMVFILGETLGREFEIEFAPHLLPVNRGILSTIYLKVGKKVSEDKIRELYRAAYEKEPFVEISPGGSLPRLSQVTGTNYCFIGLRLNTRTGNLIVVTVIDNLVKGAAGQAVQNMNIMNGWRESEGFE